MADHDNDRVRKIAATGAITTVAGDGDASPAASPLPAAGGLAQVVSGGGWSTNITLTNLSVDPVNARITFYTNVGTPLSLPLSFSGSDTSDVFTSFSDLVLSANQSVVIKTTSTDASISSGWALIQASSPLEGYAVFGEAEPGGLYAEETVSLDTRLSSAVVLPYDNTNGSQTGVALANQGSARATTALTLFDQSGTLLGSSELTLAPFGHISIFITDLFPQAMNGLGFLQVQNSPGNITGIGLLFSPTGTFTSIPIIQ